MSYTCEKLSSNKVKMTFEIHAADFDAAMQKAYIKNRNRISVPGFRKGHAPRKIIESMYGEGVFYEDAFDIVFPEVYDAAIDEAKVEAVDQPEISIDQIGAGQDLKVTCEVFVKPEVTLGDYKGLEVEIERETVTDADVQRRIEQDQAKASRTVEVLDRPVAEGDTVNLNYAGTVDGVAFKGGTAENQTLKIGSHQFIPGFEEQMVGMCVAEEKDLNVTFPEDYHAKELAGKAAVFHVKVNSISNTEMPELDDDFAADVSDFSTFAEYKADIEKQLKEQAEKNNEVQAENAVVEKAVENATVDIPEAMIKRETGNILRDMQMQMAYQGLRMEDYLKYTGQTAEQLADSYHGEAERRVKIQLVLEAIQKAENIEADEEAIEKQTKAQAERMGRDLEDFKKSLSDSQMDALKEAAAVQKTVDLMMADAKVTDKPEEKPAEPAKADAE